MDAISEDGEINLEQTRRLEQVWQGYTNFRDGDVVVAKITPYFENGKGALCANLLGSMGSGWPTVFCRRLGKGSFRRYCMVEQRKGLGWMTSRGRLMSGKGHGKKQIIKR